MPQPTSSEYEHAVLCPVCSKSGQCIGEPGAGAHLATAWTDDLRVRSETKPSSGTLLNDSASRERGSEVGFACWFEQCAHFVRYTFRFHKGEVFLHWNLVEGYDGDRAELSRS